jgi:hypothetical protein
MAYGYKEFKTQAGAFEFYEKLSKEVQKTKAVLACDLDFYGTFDSNNKGCKSYAVIGYTQMYPYLLSISSIFRCFYELIQPNKPTKMYFDIDGQHDERNNDKIQFIKSNFHSDFMAFWNDLMQQNEFGCRVLRTTMKDGEKQLPIKMHAYSSSNQVKFSQHIVFPDIVMQNNFHAGAVFRRLELWLLNKYGEDLDVNPYYCYKKKRDSEEYEIDFVLDRGVFTIHRVMRLIYNTKAAQKRFLIPDYISTFDIQTCETTVIPFKESGIADDLIFYDAYLQYFHPGRDPQFYRCCEVRTWAVNESTLTNSDNSIDFGSDFDWIEPTSVGNKIISISVQRLRRMKFTKYISKAGSSNQHLRESNDSNSSSSFGAVKYGLRDSNYDIRFMDEDSFMTSEIRMLEADSQRTKMDIVSKNFLSYEPEVFKVFQLQHRDTKRDRKISSVKEDLIKSAQRYISSRCSPDWWPHGSMVDFSEMTDTRSINLKTGRIFVYPRYFKRCQFKGFQYHKSNHVFFAIHCNPSLGEVGFLQKCHDDVHPMPVTNKLHAPSRNQLEKDLFEKIQAKMKSYTLQLMKSAYPLAHVGEEKTVSSWILISIVNIVINHFLKAMTTKLFSPFNVITNTQNIMKSVDKLNGYVTYYIELGKATHVDRKYFPQLVDEIMVQSSVVIGGDNGKKLIEKYATYRSKMVVMSLTNILLNNNFNHLKESVFLDILKKLNIDLRYPEEVLGTGQRNNSMIHINRMAALTYYDIIIQFDEYVCGKPFPPASEERLDTHDVIRLIKPNVVGLLNASSNFI